MKTPVPRKKPTPAQTKAELLPFMDYLHGDVIDGEHEAACHYEYARLSETLLAAANVMKKGPSAPVAIICQRAQRELGCGHWFYQDPWAAIWQCPSFPTKSWNQLHERDRATIIRMGAFRYPLNEIRALRMFDVRHLDQTGVLDELKAMAEKQAQAIATAGQTVVEHVHPIIEGWPKDPLEHSPLVHAVFTLDFTKTPTQLRNEFAAWLGRPENKARLRKHGRKPIGKTGVFLDRLKDIASWRIYDAVGCVTAQEFVRRHRKGGARGSRPFHDARKGQAEKVELHEAPLYGHESGWSKAQERAERYRAKLIPWEYGENATERAEQERTRAEGFLKRLKRAVKISKRSA